MIERLQHTGIILKRPFIPERTGPQEQQVFSSNPVHQHLMLLDSVTLDPERHVYEKTVEDSQKGTQKLRVIKTAKPYNPDFISSAQSLTFMFPENIADVIATPLDGEQQTWKELFHVNRQSVETMADMYKDREVGNFLIASGMNFSPYSLSNQYLRTQSVQAAHIHSFLISDKLLEETAQFADPEELKTAQHNSGVSALEINLDRRRFFPGSIHTIFSDALMKFVIEKVGTSSPHLNINRKTGAEKYPLDGLTINGQGSAFLDSEEMYAFIKDTYTAVDEFYAKFFMPIFTSNYLDIISSDLPSSNQLEYNSLDIAMDVLDEKIQILPENVQDSIDIARQQNLVKRIQPMLSPTNPERFALGPAVSYSSLFDPNTGSVKTYMVASLFGGGSVESLGINKVPLGNDEQEQLLVRFTSSESADAEKAFDKALKGNLSI